MNSSPFILLGLELLGKSLAILLAAFLISVCLRQFSAAVRHVIWLAALAAVLLLPLTKVIAPQWIWQPAPVVQAFAAPVVAVRPALVADYAKKPVPSAQHHPIRALFTPPNLVLAAWLAGVVALLAFRGLGSVQLAALRRRARPVTALSVLDLAEKLRNEMGLRHRIDLRLSSAARAPLTWGLGRPVVLLPTAAENWDADMLTAALRHEFGHVMRHDYLSRWLAHLACAFYWPNPLVWLAARALRATQEQACDDIVLRGGTAPGDYAGLLFETARKLRQPGLAAPCAVAMARPSRLEDRLLAIVDESRDRRPLGRFGALTGAVVMAVMLALSAAAQVLAAEVGKPAADAIQQVKIEAKFVEISREAAADPQLQWLKPGEPRIFANLQFQEIIKQLQKRKGVDVLSTPALVTRSGQNTGIEIGQAFLYPSEWEQKDAKWTPTKFASRHLGISFEVLPTVKEGVVELSLKPEVTGFTGYLDPKSGEKFTVKHQPDASFFRRLLADPPQLPPGKKVEPIFSTRNIKTSISTRTGETIALGGIQEGDRQIIIFITTTLELRAATVADQAEKIILPKVEFHDATVSKCIEFLRQKSRELAPEQPAVNILLHLPAAPTPEPKITLALSDVPLSVAIKYIAALAGLPLRAEAASYVIGTAP
jgi:beta-lactamase regulating signal transducer with metallopeptidase domain